jgi:hypothetical protein
MHSTRGPCKCSQKGNGGWFVNREEQETRTCTALPTNKIRLKGAGSSGDGRKAVVYDVEALDTNRSNMPVTVTT